MKKSLLVLLLAVALVVPVFAEKGDKSINAKLGLGLNNTFTICDVDGTKDLCLDGEMEMPVSLTAEFFYEFMNNLSAGIGINYSLESAMKADKNVVDKMKMKYFDVYLAVKPEAKIDSKIFTSIYAIGQIGISSISIKQGDTTESADAGIYLGFGTGTTIANQVIVELLCSSANGKYSSGGDSADIQYTAVTLNVGYKFSL